VKTKIKTGENGKQRKKIKKNEKQKIKDDMALYDWS